MISVYGLNSFGRDEVRGNGAIHLPIAPGRYDVHCTREEGMKGKGGVGVYMYIAKDILVELLT